MRLDDDSTARCSACLGGGPLGFRITEEDLWRVKCSNSCSITIHPSCWSKSLQGLQHCPDPLCHGVVESTRRVVVPSPLQQVANGSSRCSAFKPIAGNLSEFVAPLPSSVAFERGGGIFYDNTKIPKAASTCDAVHNTPEPLSIPPPGLDSDLALALGMSLGTKPGTGERVSPVSVLDEGWGPSTPDSLKTLASYTEALKLNGPLRSEELAIPAFSPAKMAMPVFQHRPPPPTPAISNLLAVHSEPRPASTIVIVGRLPIAGTGVLVRTEILKHMKAHGHVDFVTPVRTSRNGKNGHVLVFFSDPASVVAATATSCELKLQSGWVTVQKVGGWFFSSMSATRPYALSRASCIIVTGWR
jgi:hypothetical protein